MSLSFKEWPVFPTEKKQSQFCFHLKDLQWRVSAKAVVFCTFADVYVYDCLQPEFVNMILS